MPLTFNRIDAVNGFNFWANFDDTHQFPVVKLGSDLYALGTVNYENSSAVASTTWNTELVLKKSTDGGVTWSTINTTNPIGLVAGSVNFSSSAPAGYGNVYSQLIPFGNKLMFIIEPWANGGGGSHDSKNFLGTIYDPVANSWTSIEDFGFPSGAIRDITFENFSSHWRPDGTLILITQNQTFGVDGPEEYDLIVWKRSTSGAWTQLAEVGDLLGSNSTMLLGRGVMASDGTIHVMASVGAFTSFTVQPVSVKHFSVSPADVVSSLHLVASNFDSINGRQTENQTQGLSLSGDESTLAFAYIPFNEDNYTFGSVSPCDLKVAFGNLTSSPLNPSWTLTTAVSSTDVGAPSGLIYSYNSLGTSFGTVGIVILEEEENPGDVGQSFPIYGYVEQANDANKPAVYWISRGPHYSEDNTHLNWRLFSSKWNGSAWSSPPTMEYAPPGWSDPSSTTTLSLITSMFLVSPFAVIGKSFSYAFTGYLHSF